MSHSRLKVHHMNCACIQRLSISGRQLAGHCLLIRPPASGLVLVDTGLGTGDLVDPAARLSFLFTHAYAKPKRDPSLAVSAQIRFCFRPSDVRHIVMTHLDLDHVGGLADFPQATVHVHTKELKATMERHTLRANIATWQRYGRMNPCRDPHG